MASNCGEIFSILLLVVAVVGSYGQHSNLQHFVKIDVSKVNQKVANETGTTTVPDNSSTNVETTPINSTTPRSTSTTTGSKTETSTSSTTVASTTSPKTTQTPPKAEGPYEPPKEGRLIKTIPTGYYCSCDLKINICDVNCCCDIDCSDQILRTFSCSEERLDVAEYHHREGLQSCEVQGGLFCLVGEHRPPEEGEEGGGVFYDPSLKESSTKYRWSEIFPVGDVSKRGPVSTYRVNDRIKLYNETSEKIEILTLPFSLTNSECQLAQPVRYLRDQSTECLRSLEDLELFNLALLEQQASVRYLRSPKAEIMEHCLDEDCFNSSIRFCDLSGQNCQKTNQSSVNDPEGSYSWYCPEVKIRFVHNYTHLTAMETRLLCGSIDLEQDTVWQRISVEFKRKDEEKFSRKVSGNSGYLLGKPVLVTRLQIPENDTAEEKRSKKYMLSYFTNGTRDPDETFRLKLPKSRRNHCVLDDQFHHQVLFGESLWTKCNYSPQLNVSIESNLTLFCQQLQTNINDLLLHNLTPTSSDYNSLNLYLSKYGNPVNRSSDWIQLNSQNYINEPVTASSANSQLFSCNNMLLNVKYQFYHGKATVRHVPHQSVLQEAELVFGPRVNLQFTMDEEIRVPIYVQVQFFDLTAASGGSWIWGSGLHLMVFVVNLMVILLM
uniref:Tectonic n=2 Tax=Culex pipiens TaxID=7175 RepID=A0A8D8MT87_CULPI